MKLTYLTSGESPSKKLERVFDEVIVIETSLQNLESKVPKIEDEMRERGSSPFDIDNFFLYTPVLKDLGQVIERNRFNAGMLSPTGEILIGDSKIELHHASRLPFDGDSEILIVAPHFEEEYGIISAYSHKRIGDSVYILFVTDIPDKRGWSEKSHDVYRNVLGLTDDEYSFVGIPNEKVHEYKSKFQSALIEELERLKPKNVILPSDGRNFDHKNVLKYSLPIVEKSGANIILGKSVQSTGFNPRLWEVFDTEHINRLTSIYSDGRFGNPEYEFQVRNLFVELPEPLNRHVARLKCRKGRGLSVSVFGYHPIKLKHGYRIANLTSIFD